MLHILYKRQYDPIHPTHTHMDRQSRSALMIPLAIHGCTHTHRGPGPVEEVAATPFLPVGFWTGGDAADHDDGM